MLQVSVIGYSQACESNSGGISRIWVGDAADFDLTAGAPNAEEAGYSAIARRAGATHAGGADLFEVVFRDESGNVQVTQSVEEGSAQWAYNLQASLLRNQQIQSRFLIKLDTASICGQLLWVWEDYNGKIFMAGEMYVGGALQRKFKLRQNGSVMSWGQTLNNFNGTNLQIQGNYFRPPYEFTGGILAIQAMQV